MIAAYRDGGIKLLLRLSLGMVYCHSSADKLRLRTGLSSNLKNAALAPRFFYRSSSEPVRFLLR